MKSGNLFPPGCICTSASMLLVRIKGLTNDQPVKSHPIRFVLARAMLVGSYIYIRNPFQSCLKKNMQKNAFKVKVFLCLKAIFELSKPSECSVEQTFDY